MTVGELIEVLKAQPQDAVVRGYSKGCGCCGSDDHNEYESVTIIHEPEGVEVYVDNEGEWVEWRPITPDRVEYCQNDREYRVRELAEPVLVQPFKLTREFDFTATHEAQWLEYGQRRERTGINTVILNPKIRYD